MARRLADDEAAAVLKDLDLTKPKVDSKQNLRLLGPVSIGFDRQKIKMCCLDGK